MNITSEIINDDSQKFFENFKKIKNPKITFARWGNYSIAFESFLKNLGLDVIPPQKTNSITIEEGSKISPQMFCFPMKTTMGNYISAIEKGANVILTIQSIGGSCRQRYYSIVQEKILKEHGYNIVFLNVCLNIKDLYSRLKIVVCKDKKNYFLFAKKIIKSIFYFKKQLSLIEDAERMAQYLRPREIIKGQTDKILNLSLLEIEKLKTVKSLFGARKKIKKEFGRIKIEKGKDCPRVAMIGEIYTVSDSDINFDIESKLGKEEIEVHSEMNVSYHLKKAIFPWKDYFIQKKINSYLKSTVGGHGRDAIYEMLNYTEKNFDGIVHIIPFGCMPEVTVRPMLESIHKKTGIPFMSISLDEQVAEAGVNTRIEAFVDVVCNYYKNKNKILKNNKIK